MTTVGNVIDRILREYIENPSDTPIQMPLTGSLDDNTQTVTYAGDVLAPEEVASIAPGVRLEVDREIMRVISHDEATRTLSVMRADLGTEPVAHTVGALIKVSPDAPRQAIFDSVADEISALEGEGLYQVTSVWFRAGDSWHPLPATPSPIGIVEATQIVAGEPVDVDVRVVRSRDSSTGVAVFYDARRDGSDVTIRYAAAPARPTSEDDELSALGVEDSWIRAIIFGTLSNLMIHPDIDASTQEYMTEALESQGFPAGAGTDLSFQLAQLRQLQIARALKAQLARDGTRQIFVNPVV